MERMEGSDAEAVAKARGGDSEAFRALVERHSGNIFRLAYRMTGNEQDAEDVVQETFLKAYRRLGQFEERAHFGSWLYRIAANCAYDLLRQRARREEGGGMDEKEHEEALLAVPADDPPADRLIFSQEVGRRLNAALSRLSPAERSAFALRHFQGMSIVEIAETLGLDGSAAKQSIFRAVRKVRRALEPMVRTTS